MTEKSVSNKLSELFDLYKSGAVTKEEYDLLKSEIINQKETQPIMEVVVENEQSQAQDQVEPERVIEEERAKEIPVNSETGESIKTKPDRKVMSVFLIIAFCLVCLAAFLKFFVFTDAQQKEVNTTVSESAGKADEKNVLSEENNNSNTFDYEVYDTYTDRNDPYLNIRSGAGSESEIIFKLSDGEKINVIESGLRGDGKWMKIHSQSKNQTGYANSRYIRKIGGQEVIS